MSRPKIPEEWKHLEWTVSRNGRPTMYWLHCQKCYLPKGHSNSKYCRSCARKHAKKVSLELYCPGCDTVLDRDFVIHSLYFAGMSSPDLGTIFGLSKKQVMNIVNGYPKGKRG